MNPSCISRIRDIYRAISSFEHQLEATFALNINETMLLCLLTERENLLASEIAGELGLTRSNASKVIASLERKSLIRRQACKHDSRCQRFHITKKGTELLSHINCPSFCLPDGLSRLIGPDAPATDPEADDGPSPLSENS